MSTPQEQLAQIQAQARLRAAQEAASAAAQQAQAPAAAPPPISGTVQPPTEAQPGLMEQLGITGPDFQRAARDRIAQIVGFNVGAVRGNRDTREGVQRLALMAGRELGITDPADLEAFEAQVQAGRQEFDQGLGQALDTGTGRLAGQMGPAFFIPGVQGSAPARILGETTIGAILGGAAAERPEDVATGAVMGGAGGGAGAALGAFLNRVFRAGQGRVQEQFQEAVDLGDEFRVRLSAADIAPTGFRRRLDTLLEQLPVVGTMRFRTNQNARLAELAQELGQRTQVAQDVRGFANLRNLEAIADDVTHPRNRAALNVLAAARRAGDETDDIIQASGNLQHLRLQLVSDRNFARVRQLAEPLGVVDVGPVQAATREALESAQSRVVQNPTAVGLLRQLDEAFSGREFTFSTLDDTLSAVDKEIARLSRRQDVGVERADLQRVSNAIRRQLDDIALNADDPRLRRAFQQANSFHRERVVPFREPALARALEGADADTIFGRFITRRSADRAERFFQALDPKGQAAVRNRIVQEALQDATNEQGLFSPARFAAAFERLEPSVGVAFSGRAGRELDGLRKLMRLGQRSGQVLENQPTGNRLFQLLATGGFAAGFGLDPTTAAAVAGGAAATTQLFTQKNLRNFLLTASRLPDDSPRLQTISASLERALARSSAQSAARSATQE